MSSERRMSNEKLATKKAGRVAKTETTINGPIIRNPLPFERLHHPAARSFTPANRSVDRDLPTLPDRFALLLEADLALVRIFGGLHDRRQRTGKRFPFAHAHPLCVVERVLDAPNGDRR